MSALPLLAEPVSTQCYAISDRLLCIRSHDAWSAQIAAGFINRFYLTPSSSNSIDPHYTLRIKTGLSLPKLPSGLKRIAIKRGHCSIDGELIYLEIDDSLIFIGARSSRQVDVWIGQTRLARHPVAIVNVLSYAMQTMLRRCELFPLHAAGVVEPESKSGALIIGEPNSGKSTLTMQLATAGWGYLSDDMLVLSESASGVEAKGYRRVFAIAEEDLASYGSPGIEKALGAPVINYPRKRCLEPNVIFPHGFVQSCMPRAIFFPTIVAASKSRVARISQSDTMARLITMCPWASLDISVAREHLRALGQLIKQSKAYALFAGKDILKEPASAATLLAACMKE